MTPEQRAIFDALPTDRRLDLAMRALITAMWEDETGGKALTHRVMDAIIGTNAPAAIMALIAALETCLDRVQEGFADKLGFTFGAAVREAAAAMIVKGIAHGWEDHGHGN